MHYFKLFFFILILTNSLFAKIYNLDNKKSNSIFTIKINQDKFVNGEFKNLIGSLEYDEKNKKIKNIKFNVNVASLKTSDSFIDDFIKSNNILDSTSFPKIIFKSTMIDKNFIYADLKIGNALKNIKFEIQSLSVKNKTIALQLKTTIKKSYFDLNWDEFSNEKQFEDNGLINVEIYLFGLAPKK